MEHSITAAATSALPEPLDFDAANERIITACKHVQRLIEPDEGHVHPANVRAAQGLLEDVLRAVVAFDKADYEGVDRWLKWAL